MGNIFKVGLEVVKALQGIQGEGGNSNSTPADSSIFNFDTSKGQIPSGSTEKEFSKQSEQVMKDRLKELGFNDEQSKRVIEEHPEITPEKLINMTQDQISALINNNNSESANVAQPPQDVAGAVVETRNAAPVDNTTQATPKAKKTENRTEQPNNEVMQAFQTLQQNGIRYNSYPDPKSLDTPALGATMEQMVTDFQSLSDGSKALTELDAAQNNVDQQAAALDATTKTATEQKTNEVNKTAETAKSKSEEITNLKEDLHNANNDLKSHQEQLKGLESTLTGLETTLNALRASNIHGCNSAAIAQIEGVIRTTKQIIKATQQIIEQVDKKKISNISKQLTAAKSDKKEAKELLTKLKNELKDLDKKADSQKQKLDSAQKTLDSQKEMIVQSYDTAMKYLEDTFKEYQAVLQTRSDKSQEEIELPKEEESEFGQEETDESGNPKDTTNSKDKTKGKKENGNGQQKGNPAQVNGAVPQNGNGQKPKDPKGAVKNVIDKMNEVKKQEDKEGKVKIEAD